MGDNLASDEDPPTLQDVLDTLDDLACQTLLRSTDKYMIYREFTKACDILTSTVYRKLDLLSTASLDRERIEVHPEGGRITRYQRDFNDGTISMDDGQFNIEISPHRRTEAPSLRIFAVGFGIITYGALLAGIAHQLLEVALETGVLINSLLTAIEFGIIMYSLYLER